MRGAVVRAEAVIHRGRKSACVARGLHIHFGIADQQGFGGGGAEFAKNRFRADRIWFFCFKAVAAVDGAKIFREAERFQNPHADVHRLVCQNCHRKLGKTFERLGNSRVRARRIHFVIFVIREKKLQRALAFRFRCSIAQSAADQLRRAVADVTGNRIFMKLLAAHFHQHGVYGSDQVQPGVDERAVQIKNQHTHGRKSRSSHKQIIVI